MMNIHPLQAYYGFKRDYYFNNQKIFSLDTTKRCLIDGEIISIPDKGLRMHPTKKGELRIIMNIRKRPKRKNPVKTIYDILKNRMFTKKVILDSFIETKEQTKTYDPNIYNQCIIS